MSKLIKRLWLILPSILLLGLLFSVEAFAAVDTMRLSVYTNGSTQDDKYIYQKISTTTYSVMAGDKIEYDVYISSAVSGLGSIDIFNTDGTAWSSQNDFKDQNNIRGTATENISTYAYGKWYHRVLDVPQGMVGKTVAHWDLVYYNNSIREVYTAYYKNVNVTRGGNTVLSIYTGGNPSTMDIHSTNGLFWYKLITDDTNLTNRKVGAYFFYWHNFPSDSGGPGITGMEYHPYGLTSPFPGTTDSYYSCQNPDWFDREVQDMAYSGIDYIFPVVWSNNTNQKWFNLASLNNLVKSVKKYGTNQKIGLFATTGEAAEYNWENGNASARKLENIELSNTSNYDWIYEHQIKPFFKIIPKELWATHNGKTIDEGGRPIILGYTNLYFYNDAHTYGADFWNRIRTLFATDFKDSSNNGITPWIVLDLTDTAGSGWQDVGEGSFKWGAALDGTYEYIKNNWKCAEIGPGFDNRTLGMPGARSLRDDNEFFNKNYGLVDNDTDLTIIETWNELWEGSSISRCIDFSALSGGTLPEDYYMKNMRALKRAVNGIATHDASFTSLNIPAVLYPGLSLSATLRNDGMNPWTASNFELGYQLLNPTTKQVVYSGTFGTISSTRVNGDTVSFNYTWPSGYNTGDYILKLGMKEGTTWFEFYGDTPLTIFVKVKDSSGTAPGLFSLSGPINGARNVSYPPSFSWSDSSGATSYTLIIDDDSDFSSPVINQSGITGTSYTLSSSASLYVEKVYYWKVVAINSDGSTDSNQYYIFAIAPAPFLLDLPYDGATGVGTMPTFYWYMSPGATSYNLVVDNNPDFSSPEINVTGITSLYYTLTSNLANDSKYYWKVIAVNGTKTLGAENNGRLFTTTTGDMLQCSSTSTLGAELRYSYWKFSDTIFTVQNGDYLEYDVMIDNNIGGLGGVELFFTDGTFLRDTSGWQDQNGISGHPMADLSGRAYKKWYHRKMAIPSSFAGKTINKWDIGIGNQLPNIPCAAIYHNIVITRSGSVVATGYKTGTPSLNQLDFESGYGSSSLTRQTANTGNLPGAFSLNTPTNGVTATSIKPKLDWSDSQYATSYKLVISKNSDFSNPAVNKADIATSEYKLTGDLSLNTTYYWQVIAYNANGTATATDGRTFTTTNDTKLNFSATSTDGAATRYTYWKFSNASRIIQQGDWVEYDVCIMNNMAGLGGIDIYFTDGTYLRDSGWTDILGISGHPTADISYYAYNTWYHRKLSFPALAIGKTISYWVVATTNNTPSSTFTTYYDNVKITNGGSSVLTAYDTGNPSLNYPLYLVGYKPPYNTDLSKLEGDASVAPGVFSLASPADSSTGVSTTPVLDWNDASGVASYTLIIDDNPDFSSPVISQTGIASSQYTLGSSLSSNTTYYWKVIACNNFGSTNCSIIFSFTTR